MRRWVRRLFLGAVALCVVGVVVVIAVQDATPFSKDELRRRTAALFAYGAIDVPHRLAKADHPQHALFERVAAGEQLSDTQSAQYRHAFQGVLAAHQRLFRALDNNLVFATDHALHSPNSVNGSGIKGKHDLHAASAVSNFVELSENLDGLDSAGALGRIWRANEAYKNLTDLMVHLAPAVHSVVVDPLEPLPIKGDALADEFDRFRTALHQAGFAAINSPQYHAGISEGLSAYTELAQSVQARITAALSPLEHKIAGRWLALQSVSPQLSVP